MKSQRNRNLTIRSVPLQAAVVMVIVAVVGVAAGPAVANNTPAWLRHLNDIRQGAGVGEVGLNPQWDAGTHQHSCYMAQNGLEQGEDPSLPGYSTAGAEAGASATVASDVTDAVTLIDFWLTDPAQSVALLRPDWTETSLGICDGFATLDISRGLGDTLPSDTVVFPTRSTTPEDRTAGLTVDTDQSTAVCGSGAAVGRPLTVQFPEPIASTGEVTAEVTTDGATAAACAIAADTPGLPDGWNLRPNELIILPDAVLDEGRYTVAVSAGTQGVTWSFNVTAKSNTADGTKGAESPATTAPATAEETVTKATDAAASDDDTATNPDETGEPPVLPSGIELINDDAELSGSVGAAGDSANPQRAIASYSPDWLAHLNEVRRQSGLGQVSINFSWNYGTNRHSCYVVKNGVTHVEVPGRPCYTTAGEEAGKKSVVARAGSDTTGIGFIDLWLTAPFHAIQVLRPGLKQTSLGTYREGGFAGATLDVLRGATWEPPSKTVVFPGNNQTTNLNRFFAEDPDPRVPCGYSGRKVGLPLIVQFPNPIFEGYGAVNARITGPLANGLSGSISNCPIYKNKPNLSTTYSQFIGANQMIIVPSEILHDGRHTVTVTAGQQSITWSFVVRTAVARGTCANKPVTIMGTNGNDTIRGTSGDDVIYGGPGNDDIDGGGGNDTICGAEGDDRIRGRSGNDILYGNDGDDTVDGDSGNDFVNGDAGNDWLFGDEGDDRVYGGVGHDYMLGDDFTMRKDPWRRGDGNDQLFGGDGSDKMMGGGGDDILKGDNGPDKLYGGVGFDRGDGGGDFDTCNTQETVSCELTTAFSVEYCPWC